MKHLLGSIFDVAFGCTHKKYSFPIKVKNALHNHAAAFTGTYVACLDCGKDLPYDWEQMKVVVAPKASKVLAAVIPQPAINA